jgi:hypothetical protein
MKIKKIILKKIKFNFKKDKYKKVMKKNPLKNIVDNVLPLVPVHVFIIWRRKKCENTWLWTWLVLDLIAISFREFLSDSDYPRLITSITRNIYGISIFISFISLFGDNCTLFKTSSV